MIQCFVKQDFVSSFSYGCIPKLRYVSKINATYKHPRIMHGHTDILELLFVRSGTGIYIINEMRYPIQKGEMIVCNSNVLHDEAPEYNNELNTYCCAISNLQLDGLKKNCLISDNICPVIPCHDEFGNILCIMDMLYSQLSSNKNGREETCHYLMLSLLTILFRLINSNKIYANKRKDEMYLKGELIKSYIDAHYNDEELRLQSISGALNISPYYLAHLFKKIVGYSPMQYITRRRIGEAQTLLISTNYHIIEIASMVGYNNISHFNTMFFKYIGMSPRQYRNTYTVNTKEKF